MTSRSKKALESALLNVTVRAARSVVLSLGVADETGEFIMVLGGAAAGRSRRFFGCLSRDPGEVCFGSCSSSAERASSPPAGAVPKILQ